MDVRDFNGVLAGYDADKSHWDGNTMRQVRMASIKFALDWVQKVSGKCRDLAELRREVAEAQGIVMVQLLCEGTRQSPPAPGPDVEGMN